MKETRRCLAKPRQKVIHNPIPTSLPCTQNKDVGIGGGAPERGDPPLRGVWRRSRPLLPAGTSATAASDPGVVLNGVLSLFVGEAQG